MQLMAATAYAEYRQVDDTFWQSSPDITVMTSVGHQVRAARQRRHRLNQPAATAIQLFADSETPPTQPSALPGYITPRPIEEWFAGEASCAAHLVPSATPEREIDLFVSMQPKSVREVRVHIVARERAKPNPIL